MEGWIYKYTCRITEKSYIGQTINLKARCDAHIRSKSNDEFHSALRKYGSDNFDFEILEHIYGDDKISVKTRLNELEVMYITKVNSRYPDGYNLSKGGEGCKDRILTDEHKQKISKALSGRVLTEEHKQKLRKKRSPESCERIRKSKIGSIPWNKGKETPEDVTQKQVESRMWFYKQGGPNKGKQMSEEQKEKLRISHTGKKQPKSVGIKVAEHNRSHPEKYDSIRGVHLKEVHRKKISNSLKGVANTKGKMWITNGIDNKLINPQDLEHFELLGYKKGRKINRMNNDKSNL